MLLVARDDLIAALERKARDHVGHAFGRAGGQRDVGRIGAEGPGIEGTERVAQLGAAFEVGHRPAVGELPVELGAEAATALAGSGPSVPAFR